VPRQLIILGDDDRAEAWRRAATASPKISLVDDDSDAAVAISLGPRDSRLALERLGDREILVGGPLEIAHLTSIRAQVDNGWCTLPGLAWFLARAADARRIQLDVRGLPHRAGGDLTDVAWHALALLRRIDPRAALAGVELENDARMRATFDLRSGAATVTLRLHGHGHALRASAETAKGRFEWHWSNDEETLLHSALPQSDRRNERTRARRVPPAAVRALHQLMAPDDVSGDDLVAATDISKARDALLAALPHPLPLGEAAFTRASRVASERPHDLLGRLGLRGELPGGGSVTTYELPLPDVPNELWAFRAGLKPVAFLTMLPERESEIRSLFDADVHVERRTRNVHIDSQDRWTDDRQSGTPRVELYVSRDPELARRAAALQAETDPSAQLRALGELMGYPACCVDAFAKSSDRANNTRNRYATAARTTSEGPWPWELNNFAAMLVPFFPCRYDCEAALSFARGTLAEMARSRQDVVDVLARWLSKPVLYFDHDHQITLDGSGTTARVAFDGVGVPAHAAGASELAHALASGRELLWNGDVLDLVDTFTLRRVDPMLGFLAPFG